MAPNNATTGGRPSLSLEKKIKVIKTHDQNKMSARSIAQRLSTQGHPCGRTQIHNILKRKQEWIEEFESHVPLNGKRKVCKTSNDELNAIVYGWFKDSTAGLFPVSGPLLQDQAKDVAAELNLADFKASNGWLDGVPPVTQHHLRQDER